MGITQRLMRSGILALTLAFCPASVMGQSDTGRVAIDDSAPATGEQRWHYGAGIGLAASGDLFRLELPAGVRANWSPPAGGSFFSNRYTVTLDEAAVFGASISYRISRPFSLRADLGWTELNATALALIGEVVETQRYERLGFFRLGLAGEYKLVSARSYPYCTVGPTLLGISSTGGDFDQFRLGWSFGIGYHHPAGETWGLRIEIVDTVYRCDTDDHAASLRAKHDPVIDFVETNPHHLVGVILGLQGVI